MMSLAQRGKWGGGRRQGGESGQALILGVVVMLLLVFVGSIFLRSVLNNLRQVERGQMVADEGEAAQAGIRFADTQLTSSELGADWRPSARYTPSDIVAALASIGKNPQSDPDWQWLQPFNAGVANDHSDDVGGYARYNLGNARFLLRVTYNPNNIANAPVMPDVNPAKFSGNRFGPTPLSKFVMIEVVGRSGSLEDLDQEYQDWTRDGNPVDVTVLENLRMAGGSGSRLRREMVAFKAIGINNYLRFVTNPNKNSQPTYLGADAMLDGNHQIVDFPFRLGVGNLALESSRYNRPGGSPIRVNGNLVWYGDTVTGDQSPEVTVALTEDPWSVVEVAGAIGREGAGQTVPDTQRMALKMYSRDYSSDPNAEFAQMAEIPLSATADASFNTGNTRYLDNAWLNASPAARASIDPNRSIRRLEPPVLDEKMPGYNSSRYQAMTAGSNAYGYGSGMYLDNARHSSRHTGCTGDIRRNHSDGAANQLVADWTNAYNTNPYDGGYQNTGWRYQGRVYDPRGVEITLQPHSGDPKTGYIMVRRRATSGGWRNPNGSAWVDDIKDNENSGSIHGTGTMVFAVRPRYYGAGVTGDPNQYTLTPMYQRTNDEWVTWDGNAWTTAISSGVAYPFHGVIYAEGNARVRGRLPQDHQNATGVGGLRLTIVSGGTIYIEGNLMKGLDQNPADTIEDPRSQIALLARDFVCLNTTSFVRYVPGEETLNTATPTPQPFDGPTGIGRYFKLPVYEAATPDPKKELAVEWEFGVAPNDPAVNRYYTASHATDATLTNDVAVFVRQRAYATDDMGAKFATLRWFLNNIPYKHALGFGPYAWLAGGPGYDFFPLVSADNNEQKLRYENGGLLKDSHLGPASVPYNRPFSVFPKPPADAERPDQDAGYVINTNPLATNKLRFKACQNPASIAFVPPDPRPFMTGDAELHVSAVAVQPLDIVVQALVYAERQSWYVLPGAFFRDDDAENVTIYDPDKGAWRYPKNQEPVDVQVHFRGAIAEAKAAPKNEVTEWLKRWRGANRTDYEVGTTDGTPTDVALDRFEQRGGINYSFDPALITETRPATVGYLPALPRLPMCPGLVYSAERP